MGRVLLYSFHPKLGDGDLRPYLWADGVTPRKADGLVWRREDDGTKKWFVKK
jgi:hypothetical protein